MTPTSFEPHFGTNFAPTDNELKEIHELLAGPSARIVGLEAAMAQKKVEYEVLAEQHAHLSREIAHYRALASPMRRIPDDVLREIFYHCLPTEHNAILSQREAPMLLTYICKAWRAVTFSTPVLWASLHIPIPALSSGQYYRSDQERNNYHTTTLDVMRKRARAVQEWLARLGACGLKISLFDRERSNHNQNVHCDMLLRTIIPLSKRWRSVSFTTSRHHLRRIAALSAESVPSLEELAINATSPLSQLIDGAHVSPIMWTDAPLLGGPRLRRVSFTNLAEDINKLPLRWQQLTHISLEGMTIGGDNFSLTNIAALLRKCPGLITARLEIVHRYYDQAFLFQQLVGAHGGPVNLQHTHGVLPGSPHPVCTRSIVLPHLVKLSLHNGGADLSTFFAMLHVPQLIELEYHNDTPKQPAGEFITFLARVSDTLVSLTTDVQMFTRVDFFAALKSVPRLKSLLYKRGHAMGGPNPLTSHGHGERYFDDVFLGMLVGKRLGTVVEVPEQSNANAEANAQLEEGEVPGAEEKRTEDYSEVLLPKLEDLECVSAVSFTDDGLLEFLKLRQNPGHNSSGGETSKSTPASTVDAQASVDNNKAHITYTRLKRLSVVFGREQNRPVLEEIQSFINEGLLVHLLYPPVPLCGPFSPSDGITTQSAVSFSGFPVYPWGSPF